MEPDQQGMEGMTAQQILDTPDLIAAGITGDEVRRRLHGTTTSFVRVFEIHVDAVPQALPPRTDAGEVRIVGRPASIEVAVAAVRGAVVLAGGAPVTGFSLDDLQRLGPVAEVAAALGAAGLAAIAQLPLDAVAQPAQALAQIRAAGLTVNALTVVELDDEARVAICERARDLQDGSIRAFAPLPRTMSVTKPTTGYDDVKMIALARVVAENISNIQVDWALYGPKMAQVALTVGANDVDNVSAVDPGILGTRRSPLEEIRTNIKAAALEALERDGLFRSRS
jgi:uncharacterized protein with GYD domain